MDRTGKGVDMLSAGSLQLQFLSSHFILLFHTVKTQLLFQSFQVTVMK